MNPAKLWQQTENRRKRHFGKARKLVWEALDKQMEPVFQQLSLSIAPFVESISEREMKQAFVTLYSDVGKDFAKTTYRQVQQLKDDSTDRLLLTWEERMRTYVLTQAGEKISGITDTTRDIVRKVLNEGAQQGWGIDKLAREMRKTWNEVAKYRAIVIARTEILSASNQGSLAGATSLAQEMGLELDKVWLSTPGSRTRDSHNRANGQRVPLDGLFRVNGYNMECPGDSSHGAPAGEIISCRCSIIYAKRG